MADELRSPGVDPATSEAFGTLARIVYSTDDFQQVYQAIVTTAPNVVTGCDHASLMLRRQGRFETMAASDEVARVIDGYERDLGEGPCIDAISDASVFHDADLTNGSPWPRLTGRVLAGTPVRGMAGFRLHTGEEQNGALNLFSDSPDGLTEHAVHQGIVLASFISVALMASAQRETAESLRAGLHSNREIGKAVGLLMAFHEITDDEAFAMLRSTSQAMNVKLSEVARRVVAQHNQG